MRSKFRLSVWRCWVIGQLAADWLGYMLLIGYLADVLLGYGCYYIIVPLSQAVFNDRVRTTCSLRTDNYSIALASEQPMKGLVITDLDANKASVGRPQIYRMQRFTAHTESVLVSEGVLVSNWQSMVALTYLAESAIFHVLSSIYPIFVANIVWIFSNKKQKLQLI